MTPPAFETCVPAGGRVALVLKRRADVLALVDMVRRDASGRPLSGAESARLEDLEREAERLDEQARRFAVAAFEDRSSEKGRGYVDGGLLAPAGVPADRERTL